MESEKTDVEAHKPRDAADITEWKPSRHELLIIITLALVSMMISLDATIIVTSLGVMFARGPVYLP